MGKALDWGAGVRAGTTAVVVAAISDAYLGECTWRISGCVCALGNLLGGRGLGVVSIKRTKAGRAVVEAESEATGPNARTGGHFRRVRYTGESIRVEIACPHLPIFVEPLSAGSH